MMLKWSSNKAEVADRAYTICRVVKGQIEIMPDPKTGRFVSVYIDADLPAQEAPNTAPTISDGAATIIVEPRK